MHGSPRRESGDRQTRRRFLISAAGVAAATGLAACGGGGSSGGSGSGGGGGGKGPFKIGYANGYTGNSWRAQFVADIERKAAEYREKGWISDLRLVNSPADVNQQISQVNDLIGRDLDAILIDPVSAASVQSVVPRAKASGALVLISNDPAPTRSATNVVGDNATWWKMQAEWLVDRLGGRGNIVMVTGVPGNTADVQRVKAARAVLSQHPGIEVLTSVPGSWDQAKARQAMANVLATYRDIDAVLMQDVMAEGVIKAFQSAGRRLPRVMTGDYTAGFLRLWKDLPGLESIGVPYSPTHGADSLGFAVRLLQGRTLKPSALGPNPERPSLRNAVLLPPRLAITRDGRPGPWAPKATSVISLDAALARVKGRPDTYAVEAPLSEQAIDAYFA
jgi:ribose transport system substrate-binding protein